MWSALTRVPSQLQELITLLREQTSLLRELVSAVTRQPARTPLTPHAPQTPRRQYTANDVQQIGRSDVEAQMRARSDSVSAPWRTGEILPPASPPTPSEPSPPTAA